jgi:putative ABC transport system permease protein
MPGVRPQCSACRRRARASALNGVPVETARIQADVRWATGSDRGPPIRRPRQGSRVVACEWWPADYSGPPLISFDANPKRGMGLGVGDNDDVQRAGVEQARIANLRAIDWSTSASTSTVFAPRRARRGPPDLARDRERGRQAEDEIERLVTEQLPNASTIRVRAALATIDAMLGTISDAAGLTAGLTLVAGTLVLAGAMAASQRRRIYDAVVLKVLGARRRDVVAAFLIEFGLIGLAAAVVASAIGTVCAYVLWGIYCACPLAGFCPGR